MKTEYLAARTFLLGVLGLIAGGVGCSSDGNGGGQAGGSSGAPGSGGSSVTGGAPGAGGLAQSGGAFGSGGSAGTGLVPATGGVVSTGGSSSGGIAGTGGKGSAEAGKSGVTGGTAGSGAATGGTAGSGNAGSGTGGKGGSATGGSATAGAPTGGSGGGKSGGGTCTASKSTGKSVSGSGPHEVVIETNSENGIKCGTIYRPKDLGGGEKYPIFVWGEGGCSQDGYSNLAAMGEIASWGYFVIADGTPGANGACAGGQNGKSFLDFITWAIAENDKSCSAYYQSLEPTKIAADGFSCGGLMAENASSDPRFTAIGITSSGLMGGGAAVWDKIHTPFKIMNGGSSDIAYENGLKDYDAIASRKIPIIYFSKSSAGHGGDLGQARGDFNKVNLAWLNWQLKGDMGATGKGFLHGATCQFCTNSGWVYKSANIE